MVTHVLESYLSTADLDQGGKINMLLFTLAQYVNNALCFVINMHLIKKKKKKLWKKTIFLIFVTDLN